jgi:DNA-directed RNA polymerase specialized sigma24 family protein
MNSKVMPKTQSDFASEGSEEVRPGSSQRDFIFVEVITGWSPYAMRRCLFAGLQEADAKDAIQDVVLGSYRQWSPRQQQADLITPYLYLHGLLYRRLQWRIAQWYQRRLPTVPLTIADVSHVGGEATFEFEPIDAALDPAQKAVSNETVQTIWLLIGELPDSIRQPWWLHHVEDFSFETIGQLLGIAPVAAKQRAYRASNELRRRLGSLSSLL